MKQCLSTSEIRALTSSEPRDTPPDILDGLAVPSYLHWNPLIRWLMWRRYEIIAELGGFSEVMTVLEFGCGIGLFLPELVARCGHVMACDLHPQIAVRLCGQLGLGVEFVADVSAIQPRSLDAVVAADVLEHVSDLPGLLSLLSGRLRESGRLIVSGPTETAAYRLGRNLAGFGDKGAYHLRNIDDIVAAAIESGYELIAAREIPVPLLLPLFKILALRLTDRSAGGHER
jgi:SAM-dependent methyltransferase